MRNTRKRLPSSHHVLKLSATKANRVVSPFEMDNRVRNDAGNLRRRSDPSINQWTGFASQYLCSSATFSDTDWPLFDDSVESAPESRRVRSPDGNHASRHTRVYFVPHPCKSSITLNASRHRQRSRPIGPFDHRPRLGKGSETGQSIRWFWLRIPSWHFSRKMLAKYVRLIS